MTKTWKAPVATYSTEGGKMYRILNVAQQYSWKWIKQEELANEFGTNITQVPSIDYVDAECQTDTKAAQTHASLSNVKVSIPIKPIQSFLPSFEDIVDPSYLDPPVIPSTIHSINLSEKTAIVTYPNSSTRKSVDLSVLMTVDPIGVARFLTKPR